MLRAFDYDYLLGIKLNQRKEVKKQVLATSVRFTKVQENLHVKKTRVNRKQYLIRYNPYQAAKDRLTRKAAVCDLDQAIKTLTSLRKKAPKLYSDDYRGLFPRLLEGSLKN